MRDADEDALFDHCRAVAEVIPVVGFYLQPAVGGRVLPYAFWRRFAEIEDVVAIKIAPFNRYQTLDVVRAVAESGRDDIALYTGNDDNIVVDLLTPYRFASAGRWSSGGSWAGCWATGRSGRSGRSSCSAECQAAAAAGGTDPPDLLGRAVEVTDANAALFDAANGFAGCIAGIHEVLRRQGCSEGIWCLDPRRNASAPARPRRSTASAGAYPHLTDDAFVAEHRDQWLADA